MKYVVVSAVKARLKEHGKRCGKDFLLALDCFIDEKLEAAGRCHDGGRRTVDASVATWIGLRSRGSKAGQA